MRVEQDDESTIDIMKKTAEPFMFTDRERLLLRQILSLILHSEMGRKMIFSGFGEKYLRIAETLLTRIGGKESRIFFPHRVEMIEPEKDASIEGRYKGEDFCISETHQGQSMQVYKDVRKSG